MNTYKQLIEKAFHKIEAKKTFSDVSFPRLTALL
jgi:hypothetical protein